MIGLVLHCREKQKNGKKTPASPEWFPQNTFRKPSKPFETLDCFSSQLSKTHNAHLFYLFVETQKVCVKVERTIRQPIFLQNLAKRL